MTVYKDITNAKAGFADSFFKWMAGAVLPLALLLIGWGIKLEVQNAVVGQQISKMQEDSDKAAEITTKMADGVNTNAKTLVRLEAELKNANENLGEIKAIILRSGTGR